MQCHGTEIQLDENNRLTAETWPNMGMGNIYPDGSTGNCATCHTRHKFTIVEARKPNACASCHLGPDHPDTDEFERIYYYFWHHEGRRLRQGAMMGAPDWAHWHGFFELQQDLYDLEAIYNKRMETGQLED